MQQNYMQGQQQQMQMNQMNMYSMQKNTRTVFNQDPSLGGKFFNPPGLTPILPFTNAVKMTPDSNLFVKIIPWDHINKDFVYACVDDKIFKKKMSVKNLKQVKK